MACAITGAISHILLAAAVRVQSQVSSCVISGGQSCTRVGFLRGIRFPLPILTLPNDPFISCTMVH
jgi:hypothetical protein